MKDYIATFFTHYDAMQFKRALEKKGGSGQLTPVPRWLSSSCGTCVRFKLDPEHIQALDTENVELIVSVEEDAHEDIVDNR